MQLEAIASRPITSYLGEQTNTCLTTTSFQVVVESKKVSLQPPPDYTAPVPSATPRKTCFSRALTSLVALLPASCRKLHLPLHPSSVVYNGLPTGCLPCWLSPSSLPISI